jgi:hypothetical protein|tara:strand:+ start:1014 stop:1199 length:186 start_codon:yes stop_codon:yes gene_type:complete
MTKEEKAIVAGFLQREIDWCEHESQRLEYGNDYAALTGDLQIAHGHIRTANTLRALLGRLQ